MTRVNLLALQQQADSRSPEALLNEALPKILNELNDANRIEVFRLARGGMVLWHGENSPHDDGAFVPLEADSAYQKAINEQETIADDDGRQVIAPLLAQGDVFALLVISFGTIQPNTVAVTSDIGVDLGLMLHTQQLESLLRRQIDLTGKLTIASSLTDVAAIIATSMATQGQFISVNVFEYDEKMKLRGSRILATANRDQSFSANIPMGINLSAVEHLHQVLLAEGEMLVSDPL